MMKAVVVEDEDLVRRDIVLAVDWAGVDCVVVGEAADGMEGLEVIRRSRPDLIITDIQMPRLDGIEMIRRLRQEGIHAHVIILTAHSDFPSARSALRLGVEDYLLKPFQTGALEEAITQLRTRVDLSLPHLPDPEISEHGHSKYVMEALRYIAGHYNDPDISVSAIARNLGISEGHLSHVFKKETSHTLGSYLTDYRIHIAMELLRDCRSKVYEVAEQVGYQDVTYFSSTFKRAVGLSPSEYQKQIQ